MVDRKGHLSVGRQYQPENLSLGLAKLPATNETS